MVLESTRKVNTMTLMMLLLVMDTQLSVCVVSCDPFERHRRGCLRELARVVRLGIPLAPGGQCVARMTRTHSTMVVTSDEPPSGCTCFLLPAGWFGGGNASDSSSNNSSTITEGSSSSGTKQVDQTDRHRSSRRRASCSWQCDVI